jgi:hypothetical protein
MCTSRWLRITLALASAFALLPLLAHAEDETERDTAEINSYVFTEQGLEKFSQATRNLNALEEDLSSGCDEDIIAQSLDDAAARMDAIPGVKSAIDSAGMSTREYLVFSFAMLQAGMAAWVVNETDGELPPDVSMANVEFYTSHQEELKSLNPPGGGSDCEDADEG